jgi:hypothetical protein
MANRRGGSGAGRKNLLQRALVGDEIENSSPEILQELVFFNYVGIALPASLGWLASTAGRRIELGLTGEAWREHYLAAEAQARADHERRRSSPRAIDRQWERVYRGCDAYKYTAPSWFQEPDLDEA